MAWNNVKNRSSNERYVYELPYTERKCLCNILDINNQWEELGGRYMGYKVIELSEIRRAEKCGDSPTDRLLHMWGHKNSTILELYLCLYEMEHYQAMNVLLPFIPQKYHHIAGERFYKSKSERRMTAATAVTLPAPPSHLFARIQHSSDEKNPTMHLSGSLCNHRSQNNNSDINLNQQNTEPSQMGEHLNGKVPDTFLNPILSPNKSKSLKNDDNPNFPFSLLPDNDNKVLNTPEPKRCGIFPSCDENNSSQCEKRHNQDQAYSQFKKENIKKVDAQNDSRIFQPERDCDSFLSNDPNNKYFPSPTIKSSTIDHPIPSPCRNRNPSTCSSLASTMSDVGVPSIPYADLEVATTHFASQNLLGQGGFGSVYKGIWKNTKVAVKKINSDGDGSIGNNTLHITQSLDELRKLQKYRHDNILQVYGYSADEGHPHCLVYQFMPNGSLQDKLHRKIVAAFHDPAKNVPMNEILSWRQRCVIAKGTAAALQFLHTVQEKPLIHGDVKSANILLDKNCEPKLGDFGLAREGPLSQYTSMKVSCVTGTRAYIPEEYLRSKKLSIKVDTYSFGVVMFELCSGKKAYEKKTNTLLKDTFNESEDVESLRDRKAGMENATVFYKLLNIGKECVQRSSKMRPEMKDVFKQLKEFEECLPKKGIANDHLLPSSSLYPSTLHTFYDTSTSPSTHPSNPPYMHMNPINGFQHHYLVNPNSHLPNVALNPPFLGTSIHQQLRKVVPISYPTNGLGGSIPIVSGTSPIMHQRLGPFGGHLTPAATSHQLPQSSNANPSMQNDGDANTDQLSSSDIQVMMIPDFDALKIAPTAQQKNLTIIYDDDETLRTVSESVNSSSSSVQQTESNFEVSDSDVLSGESVSAYGKKSILDDD